MKLAKLKRETERLVTLWTPWVLDGEWTIVLFYPLKGEMDLPNCLAMSVPTVGERRVKMYIGRDVNWGDKGEDLELTIVHELVHTLFSDTGFDDAKRNMLETVKEHSPAAYAPLERNRFNTEEVTIDRIARLLIRAYGYSTEASCGE